MDIVVMLALVGLGLAACALLMFGNSLRRHDYEHADRLALLPIDDDDAKPASSANALPVVMNAASVSHRAKTEASSSAELAPRSN